MAVTTLARDRGLTGALLTAGALLVASAIALVPRPAGTPA